MAQPFYGWIELMSTINTLRGWENSNQANTCRQHLPNPGTEHHRDSDGAVNPGKLSHHTVHATPADELTANTGHQI